MSQKPKTYKNTFWNNKRVGNGVTLQELSECLSVDYTQLSHWLTGQSMPSNDYVKKICDLFGVDYNEGLVEFHKAHEQWEQEHSKNKSANKMHKEDTPVVSSQNIVPDDIMKSLYGVLSYEDFKEMLLGGLCSSDPSAILGSIYGKVDYNAYVAVANIIRK